MMNSEFNHLPSPRLRRAGGITQKRSGNHFRGTAKMGGTFGQYETKPVEFDGANRVGFEAVLTWSNSTTLKGVLL